MLHEFVKMFQFETGFRDVTGVQGLRCCCTLPGLQCQSLKGRRRGHYCVSFSETLPAYLSTGPVSFCGVLQLKLAEVELGRPTRFKWSFSASGGAAKV